MHRQREARRGDAFYIDRTEVTVAAYEACVHSHGCSTEQLPRSLRDGSLTVDAACNWGQTGRRQHPMNCVDWQQASTYCGKVGKALPTEAQWERVARGATDRRIFPWGDGAPAGLACWSGNAPRPGTCPVGSHPGGTSPEGVLDMVGNVWEWVGDRYAGIYYHTSPKKNPTGPEVGAGTSGRVGRGGGWSDTRARLRVSNRNGGDPGYRDSNLGFRCARPGG